MVGFPHPPSRTSPAIVGSNAASQFVGTSVMACLNSSSASGSMSTNCECHLVTYHHKLTTMIEIPLSTLKTNQRKLSVIAGGGLCDHNFALSVSLDRGRAHLDSSERQLLREVRELRQRLACRAREDSCASSQSLHKPLSHSHI